MKLITGRTCTIPEFANSRVGSSYGTTLLLGTKVWSCLSVKNCTYVSRTLLAGQVSAAVAAADVLAILRDRRKKCEDLKRTAARPGMRLKMMIAVGCSSRKDGRNQVRASFTDTTSAAQTGRIFTLLGFLDYATVARQACLPPQLGSRKNSTVSLYCSHLSLSILTGLASLFQS